MVKIANIIAQNPWWRDGADFFRYDLNLKKVHPIFFERRWIDLKKKGIYILRGPRQVGKTTYLKDMARKLIQRGVSPENILYLSLDFFTSRREMRHAIEYFLDMTGDATEIYLFLDEITSIDDWSMELKYMADIGITQRGIILATGSSAVKLKEKGELLPGRGLEGNEYYIKPLSFRAFAIQSIDWIAEYIQTQGLRDAFKRLKPLLMECSVELFSMKDIKNMLKKVLPFKRELSYLFRIYLMTGGFPGVINHYFSNRYIKGKDTIEPWVSEIFIRDVLGDLSRLQRQETIARQLFKAIINRYGSRFSFSKLSREIERNHITTIDYLEYLEHAFISFVLYPYDFNKKEPKLKGEKKVYFFDPMVFHSVKAYLKGEEVWDIITETMQDEDLKSKIVEGMVISHLLMHGEIPFMRAVRTFLWHYYDKSRREIDAIIKQKRGYLGIEIKYRNMTGEKIIKKIEPVKRYIILSKEDVGEKGETIVMPVEIFLFLLPPSAKNV